jgi:hypothetical protein
MSVGGRDCANGQRRGLELGDGDGRTWLGSCDGQGSEGRGSRGYRRGLLRLLRVARLCAIACRTLGNVAEVGVMGTCEVGGGELQIWRGQAQALAPSRDESVILGTEGALAPISLKVLVPPLLSAGSH